MTSLYNTLWEIVEVARKLDRAGVTAHIISSICLRAHHGDFGKIRCTCYLEDGKPCQKGFAKCFKCKTWTCSNHYNTCVGFDCKYASSASTGGDIYCDECCMFPPCSDCELIICPGCNYVECEVCNSVSHSNCIDICCDCGGYWCEGCTTWYYCKPCKKKVCKHCKKYEPGIGIRCSKH